MPAEEVVFEQPVADPPATPEAPTVAEPAQADSTDSEGEAATEQAKEEAETQRDDKGRFRKGLQPRIDELTRARHDAEREAAYWKGIAEGQGKSSAKADAAEKPTPDQFSDHNEYVEKLAEWKAREIVQATLSERDEKAKQAEATKARETRASTWAERQAEFAKTATDFEEVMDSAETRVPAHVLDALLEHKQGPALAYHLAKNPEIAERIAGLSERQSLIELGEVAASLGKVQPALKSVTKAPAPITPVKSGGGNVVNLGNSTQAEYEAARKAQGAWWAR